MDDKSGEVLASVVHSKQAQCASSDLRRRRRRKILRFEY